MFTVHDTEMLEDVEFGRDGEILYSVVPVFSLWVASRSVRLCSRVRRSLEMTMA